MAVGLIFSGDENDLRLEVLIDSGKLYVQIFDGETFFWVGLSKEDALIFSNEVNNKINIIEQIDGEVNNE